MSPRALEPAPRFPLRVHVLIDTLGAGGAEFLLADVAASAPAVGIDLSVASLKPLADPAPAAERLRSRGLEPAAVPVTSMIRPRSLRAVRSHLAGVRPDIVHTPVSYTHLTLPTTPYV